MLNAKWFRALGISIPVLSVLVFWDILVSAEENLFQTGITPSAILGIANIFLAWAIYKNKI